MAGWDIIAVGSSEEALLTFKVYFCFFLELELFTTKRYAIKWSQLYLDICKNKHQTVKIFE